MKRSNQGFTLLEILVAIAIILVVTAVGVVSYTAINKKARDSKRTSDMQQIRQALEMYRSDNGFYPSVNVSGFDTTANLGATLATYMTAVPVDPKDSETQRYLFTATNALNGNYYGYCLCVKMENTPALTGTCSSISSSCNYGERNP